MRFTLETVKPTCLQVSKEVVWCLSVEFAPLLSASFLPSGNIEQIFIFSHIYNTQSTHIAVCTNALQQPLIPKISQQPASDKRQSPKSPCRMCVAPPQSLPNAV